MYFNVLFVVVKVSKRRSTDILSVRHKNLCSVHQSNINSRSKVSTKHKFIIRELGRVMVHHPIIPTELTCSADVGGVTGHNSLRDLAGGHVNTVGRAGLDHHLQLNTVIPESFGGIGSNH